VRKNIYIKIRYYLRKFVDVCKDCYFYDGEHVKPTWLPFVIGIVGGTILMGITALLVNEKVCSNCRTLVKKNTNPCPGCGGIFKWK
jgi:hypothetical protein